MKKITHILKISRSDANIIIPINDFSFLDILKIIKQTDSENLITLKGCYNLTQNQITRLLNSSKCKLTFDFSI